MSSVASLIDELAASRTGFLAAVNCGASANTFTCQPCAAAGQGPAK